MQKIKFLTQEVDRIVTAPYAVSLKRLLSVLEQTSTCDLHIWTLVKTCQIRPLVSRVLRGISTDHCSRPILYSLIRAERIRNHIILQHSSALQEVFFHVETSHDCHELPGNDLVMFNTRLPETWLLPDEGILFLQQTLANIHNVSAQVWVRQIRNILHSCGPDILQVMDEDTVRNCFRLWGSVLKTNQNFEFLCCLDIACMLQHSTLESNPSRSTSESMSTVFSALDDWRSKAGSLLIHRCDRLIRSLLLRALYFVSDRPEVTGDDALEAATMIKDILQNIDQNQVRATMQEKENVEALAKLVQKINSADPSLLSQLIMFNIVHSLNPSLQVTKTLRHIPVEAILAPIHKRGRPMQQTRYIDNVQKALQVLTALNTNPSAAMIEEAESTDYLIPCLHFAIGHCMPGKRISIDNMLYLEQSSLVIEALHEVVRSSHDSSTFARCISSLTIPEWWSMTFTISEDPEDCAGREVCPHLFEALRQNIILEITKLVTKICCTYGLQLSRSSLDQLMQRSPQAFHDDVNHTCMYAMPGEGKGSRTMVLDRSIKWNQDLSQELSSLNELTCRIIQSHVDKACRDLEDRCETVETPLRAARSNIHKLEAEMAATITHTRAAAVQHEADCEVLQVRIRELERGLTMARESTESIQAQQALDQVEWQAELETLRANNMECQQVIATLRKENADLNVSAKEKAKAIQQLREEGEACASTRDILHLELSEAREKEKKLLSVLFENKDV